ncbi:terpene synthase [Nonomuraea sp. PA05]|uniref:terpene synthase family protein n=1 Tax=Nonomuraea sp. PA05 TaxID=2604466 RepID=UPI0011D80447|nr:terpene synthase family protein [Nonomuraea sp. PA05]TYB68757.1 terpene synthase [Nonomuraea sp. PA05]
MNRTFETGRTCAVAVVGGRDLARVAARYGELFPQKSFDAGLYSSLALAGAFGSPWATAVELRAINRASLLVFAVDRLIDEEAISREQVAALVADCLAAAGGQAPASPAAAFLADLRGELAAGPELLTSWRDQLGHMLAAMTREWDWARSGPPPGPEEYVANADSTGAYFIALTHWIHTGQARGPRDLERLRPAGEAVQRYLRLLNDVATRRREARSGDLNAFTLGLSLGEVNERMTALTARATELIGPLREEHPRAAAYLDWQLHFSAGFYGLSDFWAEAAS